MNSNEVLLLWEKHHLAKKIMELLSKLFSYGGEMSTYAELRDNLSEALGGEVPPERIDELLKLTYKQGKWQDVCKYYLIEIGLEVPELEGDS